MDYEDLADRMFNTSFDSLSEFGKREVRLVAHRNEPTMADVDVIRALAAAQARISELEKEKLELWRDNEELQMRLMETEDEDSNLRSTDQ